MEQFYSTGFVCVDTLAWEAVAGDLKLKGEIGCKGNIVIDVFKLFTVGPEDENPFIQTYRYAYNASMRGYNTFLRHDNAHPFPGHPDQHHRHEFDWRTGEETPGSPRWVGVAGWPTLGQFIQEIADWYWKHRESLPAPDGVPTLGLR